MKKIPGLGIEPITFWLVSSCQGITFSLINHFDPAASILVDLAEDAKLSTVGSISKNLYILILKSWCVTASPTALSYEEHIGTVMFCWKSKRTQRLRDRWTIGSVKKDSFIFFHATYVQQKIKNISERLKMFVRLGFAPKLVDNYSIF